jgi:hypothetical protein
MKFFIDSKIQSSLFRNFSLQFFFWCVFSPGFFSSDSFTVLESIQNKDIDNNYTSAWSIYVKIFTFNGEFVGLITLMNSLILVYSLTQIGYSLFKPKIAAISTLSLTSTPLIFATGITLWHDILMSSGLILITSFFIRFTQNPKGYYPRIWLELIPGSILTIFRPNGLPTLILFSLCVIAFFYYQKRPLIKTCLYLIIFTLTVNLFFILLSSIYTSTPPINRYFALEWMRNDISCYVSTSKGSRFIENSAPQIGNSELWKSKEACTFLNKSQYVSGENLGMEPMIPKVWLELFSKDWTFIISTHSRRNAYLIPVPIFGIPKVPFIHSTIEFKNQGIVWNFEKLAESARPIIRFWNYARGLFAWSGLWLMVVIIGVLASRKVEYWIVLFTMLSLSFILFIVSPIPDGRYVLVVLILGQLIFLGEVINRLSKRIRR